MTPQEQKIMEQALEALETYHEYMEPLLTVFGGPRVPSEKSTTYKVEKAIIAIKEALAQQPQNEVRGLSHSNGQSKCNHTKTITRADIDGNQIETTCGECGERVAQQPQDVVRGLLSNEQVEPLWYAVMSETAPIINKAIRSEDVANEYADKCRENYSGVEVIALFAHPPVPYVVEPRTAQPEPLDTPLPCDVKVGHVTIRKGVALSVLVARMQVLYDMAQPKEPEQEPVAYFNPQKGGFYWAKPTTICAPHTVNVVSMPLYTTPPQRTWVGLTEKDKEYLSDLSADPRWNAWIGMEQTEAKLKEKNT